jgi:uncharacterized membrane protein YfcA
MEEMMTMALSLVFCGALAGFMAGLLGIGGGAVMVPVLYEVFGYLGIDEAIRTHMAVATSLAVILPTGLLSAYGHNKKQSVDWPVVRVMGPLVVVGVAIGALIARSADGATLRLIYGVAVLLVACFLLWSQRYPQFRLAWPSNLVVRLYGVLTGVLSTLMGIGGGTFTGSFMTLFGRSIHKAVGTAAAIGPIIALPAILGMVWAGWGADALPPFSLGFVSLIGAVLILPTSLLFAPLGVRAAHWLRRETLELLFALFLVSVGVRFLYSVMV